jgi:outer membrane murein-binding lipoprotein Lpp
MIQFGTYLLIINGIVSAIVLAYLIKQGFSLVELARGIELLPATAIPTDQDVFVGRSEFAILANDFVAGFRRADANRSLSQFDVEKQMTPFILRLRTVGGSTRGIAGLLILVALVTTLLNLHSAVAGLGQTFHDLADHSRAQVQPNPADVVDSVQRTMGNVADTAATAFFLSGLSVLFAVVLLFAALGVQRQAQLVLRHFAKWSYGVYCARIAETSTGSEAEQRADFSDAIAQFRTLVESFGTFASELSNLGDFRNELSSAVSTISTAVDRLPAAIQANMTTLSSQVTREIAEDLKHQYEILKKLLAAYGDLGLNMKAIENFTAKLVQHHAEVSVAIANLGALPKDARKLATVIADLATTVAELNDKTDAIPSIDIKFTKTADSLRAEIGALGTTLVQFRDRSQTKEDGIETTVNDLVRALDDVISGQANLGREAQAMNAVRTEFARLKTLLETMDTKQGDYGRQMATIITELGELQKRTFFDLFRGGRSGSSAR